MRHILVPIDTGHAARTRSAIDQVLELHRKEPSVIHLLRVQPPVSGHVSAFFQPAELHALQVEWGHEELQPAQRQLDAAGVPYLSEVRVGHSAQTIAAVAREHACDRIIFGVEAPGLAERLFGSLAQQVRHLMVGQGDAQVLGS